MALTASMSAAPHLQAGSVLYGRGELLDARREFSTALKLQPDLSPARYNIAVICRELEQNDEAEQLFQQVVADGEIVADSYNNLGILAVRREAFAQAEEYFRQAIRLRHQFPLAHFNLGTLLLRMGQWDEGFREYEWRWQTPSFTPLACPQPQWDGQPLDGTLLLHTEQGIGDVLQFARFIPRIRERCRRLIFVRPDHLDCMFPTDVWADEVRSPGEIGLDCFQAVLPLMSAPHVLGLSMDQLPVAERYLSPADRRIDLGTLPVADAKLRVGITWCGSPTHVNDAFRSTTLDRFAPLLRTPGVAFYSLQVGPAGEALNALADLHDRVRDLGPIQSDLADAAAIVRQLDLVITVDTAVLHLCGGLGLPVWGLLSRRCDWRWLDNDQTSSSWYPTLRLFRQRKLNDWDELIGRVAQELTTIVP